MANSGVNVKMGVSGVAQFKQNMNQAKQAVKTLDAQLALSEKQFKQTGDSQSYMAEKGALLEAKLENQKKVLAESQKALEDMASKGIDKSSKAYQDMYRAMIEAKGAIIDTENAMNGVTEAGDNAASQVSEMNAQLKEINKGISFQNVESGIKSISDAIDGAIKKAISLGKAIVNDILGSSTWADDLLTLADYYEMDQEDIQRMERTAKIIDTPVQAILEAKKKLKKEKAQAGEKDMGAWAALGINPNDARDADDLFWRTGEALMNLGEEYDKEAYAQELFGRSWNELIPVFKKGRAEYEALNATWNVVPQQQVEALGELNDQYEKLKDEFSVLKMTVEGAFAEPLKKAMEILTNLFEKLNEYLASPDGQAALQKFTDAFTSLVEKIGDIDAEEVVKGVQSVFDKVVELVTWVNANGKTVLTMLGVGVGSSVGLKVVHGVHAAKQLFNWGNSAVGTGADEVFGGTAESVARSASEVSEAAAGAADSAADAAAMAEQEVRQAKLNWRNRLRQKSLETAAHMDVSTLTNSAFVGDWFTNYTEAGKFLSNKLTEMLGGEGDKVLFHGEENGIWGDLIGWAEEAVKFNEQVKTGEANEFFNNLLFNGAQKHQQWLDKQEENAYWEETHQHLPTVAIPDRKYGIQGDIRAAELHAASEADQRALEKEKERKWLTDHTTLSAGPEQEVKKPEPTVEAEAFETVQKVLGDFWWELMNGMLEFEPVEETSEAMSRMEEAAEELTADGAEKIKTGGKDISGAADKMEKLPDKTAAAVREGLNGAQVVIDGEQLTAVVGEIMARWVSRE